MLRMRDAYDELVTALPPDRRDEEGTVQIRWMLEELRVSFFAQQLGTPETVSVKRIHKALDQLA
jgi:ATP-dependent helicase HrpA